MRRFLAVLLGVTMILSLGVPVALAEDATFTMLYSGEMDTLNYLVTTTTNNYSKAANFMDTLVEYDRFGQVQPSLAESWETSEDGLVWTFHLRAGVKWVDGAAQPVADVTAHDFVAAAQYILDAKNASGSADVLIDVIEGAEAYFDGTSEPEEGEEPAEVMEWETVGVKALDDLTIQYTLFEPTPYFLSMLTYVPFMPVYEPFLLEKGEAFGLATGNDTLLYCGAYYISEFRPQEKLVLSKNPLNWDADNVFIESLVYIYNAEASTVSPEMYLRGEIDYSEPSADVAMEWLNDPVKAEYLRPERQVNVFPTFYGFNFTPNFDEVYEPENWLLAANNKNFRKAIYHGLDRLAAMTVVDRWNPEALVFNSVTPPDFTSLNGKDYTEFGNLAAITALGLNTFDEAKALEYRDAARAELEAAGATFPIKILMPFNPNVGSWSEECQVVEQQLEALLGSDFIDILPEAGPTQGFLSATRRAGMYALQKLNWGPDYLDPQTFVDPFAAGNNYNFMDKGMEGDFVETYYAMVAEAKGIVKDMEARYTAFANAEAYLIDNAVIIPFGHYSGGYLAAKIDPFEGQYASFGISSYRYKGQHVLDHPMSTDEYFDSYDKWLEERAALFAD